MIRENPNPLDALRHPCSAFGVSVRALSPVDGRCCQPVIPAWRPRSTIRRWRAYAPALPRSAKSRWRPI